MTERHEGIERLMPTRGEPACARRGVFGEREAFPTGGFGRGRELRDRPGFEHVGVGAGRFRILVHVAHLEVLAYPPSPTGATPNSLLMPTSSSATFSCSPELD